MITSFPHRFTVLLSATRLRLFLVGFAFAFPLYALAAPGDLDTTFGTGGTVTTDFGSGTDFGNRVAVQSDGKILVAGWTFHGSSNDFALARYLTNGALDLSFGTGGKVTTDFGGDSYDIGQSVALQSDGKIVVTGYTQIGSYVDFALARYTANGALDPSFGTGGKVTTPIGTSDDVSSSVAVQNDGKIVVAGYSVIGSTDDFALMRYTASGALDPSFGTGGKVTTNIGGNERGSSVVLQSDGKIIVSGFSGNENNADFALVRYTANGALDLGFGTGGKVTTDFNSGSDAGSSVALQSDGKIIVAGYSSGSDFALARYLANGALDPSFGTGGKMTTDFGASYDVGYGVAIQTDGKIVVVGYSAVGGTYDFALARYTTSGALDSAFGTGGKVTTDIGFNDNRCYSAALQSDGKIVVAGYSHSGSTGYDFALARYFGDSAIAPAIIVQPQSQIATAGQSTTFTVQVTANPTPTYQWRRFGIDIPSATGATLTLNNVQVADAANYSVFVRNSAGIATSASAQLSVFSNFTGVSVSFPTYSPLAAVPAGADSLVFITHGRTLSGADNWSGPNGQLAWLNKMKTSIQGKVPGNWTVMTYEWEVESRTLTPATVLGNAKKVGNFVGNELANLSASRPNGRWAHVHFIAHSAGSALIDVASRLVKEQHVLTEIHTTFLDPFTGVKDGGREEYGAGSDWSDNYYSFSPDTLDGELGRTFGPMLYSHDVEVTWLDPDKTLSPQYCAFSSSTPITLTPCSYFAKSTHGWPIKFYQNTIDLTPIQLDPDYEGYGFPRSKEGGGWANRGSYPVGNPTAVHVLGAQSGIPPALRPVTASLDIDFANTPNAVGHTGQVQFTASGVSLLTGSTAANPPASEPAGPSQTAAAPPPPTGNPAWISILANVTSSVNFVTFNAEFTGIAGSRGLLTVYWNDEGIGQIDELTILPGVHSYTFEIENAFLDRSNSLGFRLDQFSNVASSVNINNVSTGFAGLPTPAKLKIESVTGISTPVLTVTGTQNFTYLVETSPDLVNWELMAAVTLDTGVNAALTDPDATALQLQFYRVVSP